jgi:hypothetical protein
MPCHAHANQNLAPPARKKKKGKLLELSTQFKGSDSPIRELPSQGKGGIRGVVSHCYSVSGWGRGLWSGGDFGVQGLVERGMLKVSLQDVERAGRGNGVKIRDLIFDLVFRCSRYRLIGVSARR